MKLKPIIERILNTTQYQNILTDAIKNLDVDDSIDYYQNKSKFKRDLIEYISGRLQDDINDELPDDIECVDVKLNKYIKLSNDVKVSFSPNDVDMISKIINDYIKIYDENNE